MLDVQNEPTLKDGEPCNHPGCLSHVSHPCEGCGRIGGYKKATPPKTIYLQCYDESGNLLDLVSTWPTTWCQDRINSNDAVYVLVTPELARLLDKVINLIQTSLVQMSVITTGDLQDILTGDLLRKTIDRVRALLDRVEGNLR